MKVTLPYFVKRPVVALALCGLAAIAWYSPANIRDAFSWQEPFTKLLATIFPPIAAYASKSAFPAATALYMAFAFLLFPLHFFYALSELRTNNKERWFERLWNIQSMRDMLSRFFLIPIVTLLALFGLFLNPGYDFNLLPLNSSRAALALGGWLIAGAIPAWCLSWVYCNLVVLIKHFLNGGKNDKTME